VYTLWHFNLRFLRRSQTFQFKSVVANDGSVHWTYAN
jgi:hypothetical protein